MYSMSHPAPPINGGIGGGGINDGSGTINPAALNAPVSLPHTPGSNSARTQASPRGIKRSRSPDGHYDPTGTDRNDEDDSKPRKRGRPPKGSSKVSESPSASHSLPPSLPPTAQTPQSSHQAPSQASPTQTSPTKTTPTKSTVIKALPTVRDHTSTDLNEQGDEFIPREYDEAGETKVAPNGTPLGGRQYRCRTFFMPNRGDKLFMLATECAKNLAYRDSYLLFNKNKSLYKIIANQAEKNDLIQQDILPSSYRSRQIAIVTARSMFRQFGSRLIVNGRRVRDDYWESKARKQGFTEEDAAGEKRPGAAKAREAAAAAEANNAAALASLPQGQIIYNPTESSTALAPVPMINMNPADDLGDYSNVQRPRHEISGSAYQDRTLSSTPTEIMSHATQTAEYNKSLGHQRTNRGQYLEDVWRRPHEPPSSQLQQSEAETTATSQARLSPQMPSARSMGGQQGMSGHNQQPPHQMMAPQSYSQQPMHPSMIAQSPVRSVHQQLPPGGQMHHRSPPIPIGNSASQHQQPYSSYQQGQMWPSGQGQTQPSPLSQAPMQYGQHGQHGQHLQQQSPHMQQSAIQPQLHHSGSSGSLHNMGYNVLPGGMSAPGYSSVPRQQMYQPQQPSQNPQHYMHQSTAAGTQPGMQGWSPAPSQNQPGQQGWQSYQ